MASGDTNVNVTLSSSRHQRSVQKCVQQRELRPGSTGNAENSGRESEPAGPGEVTAMACSGQAGTEGKPGKAPTSGAGEEPEPHGEGGQEMRGREAGPGPVSSRPAESSALVCEAARRSQGGQAEATEDTGMLTRGDNWWQCEDS